MIPGSRSAGALLLAVIPLVWVIGAGEHALGHHSVDLLGHLWHHWHAAREPLTTTTFVRFPEGVDLMPITGGWLDVWLGAWLVPWMGVVRAWNVVIGLLVLTAGVGGAALARSLGAAPWTALVAGLLLQLDGFLLLHLAGGRSEQLGLGLIALALAGAIRLGRPESARWEVIPVACSGALVVALSWELALGTAAGLVLLSPVLLRRHSAPRMLAALALAGLLCLPGVWSFLARASEGRAATAQGFGSGVMDVASLGLGEWLGPHRSGPHSLTLLTLLVLPWTVPRRDRRLWAGFALLLAVSLGLALGHQPAWHRGGPPFWTGPTLWDLSDALPVLAWFHWPDRLTVPWSLLAPTAAALALTRLAQARPRTAAMGAALLLAGAGLEHQRANRGPYAEVSLAPTEGSRWLGEQPGDGAVLDLPLKGRGRLSQAHLQAQLTHGRPTRAHPFLDHLVSLPARPAASTVRDNPALQWFTAVHPRAPAPAAPLQTDDLRALHAVGFEWVVLHGGTLPVGVEQRVEGALVAALGPPTHRIGRWRTWSLAPPTVDP